MKLDFENTGYLRDFKAYRTVPSDWTDDDSWLVEFAAYDCSSCETEHERGIFEKGLDYECIVRVIHDPVDGDGITEEHEIARCCVPYEEDAEMYLQECADVIYG